jgi:hypothetical protein
MASLVNISYLVKKIIFSHSFDQACRDVIEFVSKEKIATTIMNLHKHRLPPRAKLNNIEPFNDEYDFEAINQGQRHGRSSGSQNFPNDRNLNAMEFYTLQMDWVNKLTPEEKRHFENQLCIGCGQSGHIRRNCPTKKPVYNRPAQPFVPQRNNNFRANSTPQHNMGG